MKLHRFIVAGLLASAAMPAAAQDTPAFRVPLQNQGTTSTSDPAMSWVESVSSCSTTCGTGTRTTSYQCQDVTDFDYVAGDFGVPEPEAQCVSAVGAKPADKSSTCTVYSGCNYDWITPPENVIPIALPGYPVGREGCGQVQRSFTPYCERSDGTQLAAGDHAFCSGDLPDYNDVRDGVPGALGYDNTAIETSSCVEIDHHWDVGAWGPSSSTCSATAFQTRPVTCVRTFDGATQVDGECSAPKPATSQSNPDYSGCTYAWQTTGWGSYDSTCSSAAKRTRTVWCQRSDGTGIADSYCDAGSRPAGTDTNAVYSGCTYAWQTTGWGAWDSTCSSTATRSRTVWCQRSDGTGAASSSCDAGTMPSPTNTQAVYSGCNYSWQTGGWSSWDSTCSTSANRTRSVTCLRSDGTTVANSSCDAGTKPSGSQTQGVYSSCSYGWKATPWSAWDSECSTTSNRTRSVTCQRSDGATVADSNCTTAKWAESQTQARYGSCSYSWKATPWSAWDSDCSTAANRTRTVFCQRSNGDTVADSNCTTAKWAESQTQARYGSCSYSWVTGSWSGWSSTCSSNANRTRSVTCRRSDGSTVGDANCDAGTRPSASQTQAVYGGCSYSWNTGAWGAWSSTCSASATRNRSVNCRRSDGTNVGDANCTNPKPTGSQTQAVYSGCGYNWETGSWSGWSSTCSGTAMRTRSVICKRSDGTTVGDANCTAPKPAATDSGAQYGGCTYEGTYGTWGTCTSGSQTRSLQTCTRSDGVSVALSTCTSNGVAGTETQACTSCDYTDSRIEFRFTYKGGAVGSSTSGSDTRAVLETPPLYKSGMYLGSGVRTSIRATITGPDGTTATTNWTYCDIDPNGSPKSSCQVPEVSVTADGVTYTLEGRAWTASGFYYHGKVRPSTGGTTQCTGTPSYSYTPTYGSWSACSGGTQSRSMTSCTRNDGATVATSYCTGSGSPATQSQSCASGPCGTWQQSGTASLPVVTKSGPEGTGFYPDTTKPAPSGMSATQKGLRDTSPFRGIQPTDGIKNRVRTADGQTFSYDTGNAMDTQPTAPPTSACVQDGLEYWTMNSIQSTGHYGGGYNGQYWGKCVCN